MFGRKKKLDANKQTEASEVEREDALDMTAASQDDEADQVQAETVEVEDFAADEPAEGDTEVDEVVVDDSDDDDDDLDEVSDDDDDAEVDDLEIADEAESDDEGDGDDLEPSDPIDDSLREDGPFDVNEVDLEADDIDRLDFGTLILTPIEDMKIQLQINQETQVVQSALIMIGNSALEIALFAAPSRTSIVADVARDMVASTTASGGEADLLEGPFGPEVRRVIPVEAEGQQAYHVSRTWFAQGPRWLLRAVMMGEAALVEGFEDENAELLLEFFCNIVVNRGERPYVPGDLIPMELPEELAAQVRAES